MDERFRDRVSEWLSTLGRRQLTALALLGALTIGGAVLWYVRSLPRAVTVVASTGGASARASPSPAAIVVDVAGWVHDPGVYDFQSGDRVIDAIRRAGGPRRGADLTVLNLAALLTDAQHVLVPRKVTGSVGAGGGSGAGVVGALVNLNTATLEDLETLSGIGPVLAQRIVDFRTEKGPFTAVDQLKDVSGIGDKRFEDLKDEVTV